MTSLTLSIIIYAVAPQSESWVRIGEVATAYKNPTISTEIG
jgi:hypothetical protein